MNRSIGTHALALFAALIVLPLLLASCSDPSSAPATTAASSTTYSASAFFQTETLGDTTHTPAPFCFPVQYLQQALGLTDSQALEIQNKQDSLRTALQARLDALKAAGTLTPDSVRELRMEFATELYTDVTAILTSDQLAKLQTLTPPRPGQFDGGRGPGQGGPGQGGPGNGGPGQGGPGQRGPGNGGPGQRPADSSRVVPSPAQMDSLMLAQLQQVLTTAGDALTADQLAALQQAQATITADTTLTPDGRRAAMQTQLQAILTAAQLADLKALEDAGHKRHH